MLIPILFEEKVVLFSHTVGTVSIFLNIDMFKGIVLPDWIGLKVVWLERS